MKRFTIQFIAIPFILVTIVAIILTKIHRQDEITTAGVKQTASTMPRVRDASATATPLSPSLHKKSLRSEGESIQKIAHVSGTHSEEYWKDYLAKVQNDNQLNDRQIGSELILIASNPNTPEWARVKAIANALVFTDDENYDHDIKPLAIRTDLPDAVHDVILEDLLNRPSPTVMPVARQIANTRGHQLADALDEFVKSYE